MIMYTTCNMMVGKGGHLEDQKSSYDLVAGLVVCFFPNVERIFWFGSSLNIIETLQTRKVCELTDFVQDCSLPPWTPQQFQLDDMLVCALCRTFTPTISTYFRFRLFLWICVTLCIATITCSKPLGELQTS